MTQRLAMISILIPGGLHRVLNVLRGWHSLTQLRGDFMQLSSNRRLIHSLLYRGNNCKVLLVFLLGMSFETNVLALLHYRGTRE